MFLCTDHQALEPSIKLNNCSQHYIARSTRWLDQSAHFRNASQQKAGSILQNHRLSQKKSCRVNKIDKQKKISPKNISLKFNHRSNKLQKLPLQKFKEENDREDFHCGNGKDNYNYPNTSENPGEEETSRNTMGDSEARQNELTLSPECTKDKSGSHHGQT